MTLPRVRFTVRRMMVVVAVLGGLFGAGSGWRRYNYCNEVAATYQSSSEAMRDWEKLIEAGPPNGPGSAVFLAKMTPLERRRHNDLYYPSSAQRALIRRRAVFYAREKRRFSRASWRFWEMVPAVRRDPAEQ
jgi:hypothetical protein